MKNKLSDYDLLKLHVFCYITINNSSASSFAFIHFSSLTFEKTILWNEKPVSGLMEALDQVENWKWGVGFSFSFIK